MELHQLARQFEVRGLHCHLGLPATDPAINQAEERLSISFPVKVKRFYQHYNGFTVENPPFEVLTVDRLVFIAAGRLHFATVYGKHPLCFDVSHYNEAGQWDILTAEDG